MAAPGFDAACWPLAGRRRRLTPAGHRRGRARQTAQIRHHGGVGTRILAVEDDERIRAAVKLALEDEGWTVDEAESGEEAIEVFERKPPTSC